MSLREQLDHVRGSSAQIVAVFFDIRGFSAFSQSNDSVDVGVFIAQSFKKTLDEYFPTASFCKSTGDGLLLIYTYEDEASLRAAANSAVSGAIRCVSEFSKICEGNVLVNFACPELVGFGIARGAASCLTAEDEVIDYSGHRLNLAARLMDVARPAGIVIDGDFGIDLLDEELREKFTPDEVFIRGLAEEAPHQIYVQTGFVQIPEERKKPLRLEEWNRVSVTLNGRTPTYKDWRDAMGPVFRYSLPHRIKRSDAISLVAQMSDRKNPGIRKNFTLSTPEDFSYVEIGNSASIHIRPEQFLAWAKKRRAILKTPLPVQIDYVAAD